MGSGGLFWLALLATAPLYWLLPRFRGAVLVGGSAAYLLTVAPGSTAGLLVCSILFFMAAPLLRGDGSRARILLAALILSVLGYLSVFKYFPFVAAKLASCLGAGEETMAIALPLGISYYTFKLIHYAVETHRGSIEPHPPVRFLEYLLFFPIFPAGPIERFNHFHAGRGDRWDRDHFVAGATRITYGLIKKFVIAESFIMPLLRFPSPSTAFMLQTLPERTPFEAWAHVSAWFVYLYFDFSGYSDIAIGSARLFSFRIMENFDYPILVPNLREFWSRWHISLTRWCYDYVFVPVSLLTRRPAIGTLATLAAVGLWHGGTLNWLCFGLYHGAGLVVFEAWSGFKRRRKLLRGKNPYARALARVLTFLFLSASFAFVVTDDFGFRAGLRFFAKLLGIDVPA